MILYECLYILYYIATYKYPLFSSKAKIESEWKKFRGRKARIFWPPITDGISDSWGNKFWHCEFGEETKNEVDVCYNGMFTTIDGTEGFSSDGKCTIRSAKANLLKDWEILLVE